MSKLREDMFHELLSEIGSEFGREYVFLALKKINDQQLFLINFGKIPVKNDPVIKVMDLIIREIDQFLFHSEFKVEMMEQAKDIILTYLVKCGVAS